MASSSTYKERKSMRIVCALLFLMVLFAGLLYVDKVAQPNIERDAVWGSFKRLEKNSLNVLFTGSSKVHANINPAIIWEKSKITSFDLSGNSMDFLTQYAYLKEAYKTQNPQLVVIDIHFLNIDVTQENIQKRNISTMPFGLEKIGAVLSTPIPVMEKESWLFPLEQNHSRFYNNTGVTQDDYQLENLNLDATNTLLGYRYLETSQAVSDKVATMPLDEELFNKNYKQLKKSLDFLKSKDCKVVLISTPEANKDRLGATESELDKRIARDYPDVETLWARDYQDGLGLDYATDFQDKVHLNALGAKKHSNYLAEVLSKRVKAGEVSSRTVQRFMTDSERYHKLDVN